MRLLKPAALLVVLQGCDCTEVLVPEKPAVDQVDIFEQKAAAQVDILWVVDNSESMLAEQSKVASRFNDFFNQLLTSQVDYHIGVVTTDPAEQGELKLYVGPDVDGCDTCRFLTKSVPCDDPEVDVSGMNNADAEAELLDKCPAQLVFRKLISVGATGSASEEAFLMAADALGVRDVDVATGLPMHNPPEANDGFIRPEASLYIVFVSDEEEGQKQDGAPIRYYQRLFEGLKGAGNENKVAVAAIIGYPTDGEQAELVPPLDEACGVLGTTFDASAANDDPRAEDLQEAFAAFDIGCDAEGDDDLAHAETGGRFIELACRTGGVVANMCEEDYSTALDALGANAAGLLRKFVLSKAQDMEFGNDCDLFTKDDLKIDCDGNDSTNDDIDGPICVRAKCLGGDKAKLIERDDVAGWKWEANTSSVRFDGRCLPSPGSKVEIQYLLARKPHCGG
jgi:hypothetical protein